MLLKFVWASFILKAAAIHSPSVKDHAVKGGVEHVEEHPVIDATKKHIKATRKTLESAAQHPLVEATKKGVENVKQHPVSKPIVEASTKAYTKLTSVLAGTPPGANSSPSKAAGATWHGESLEVLTTKAIKQKTCPAGVGFGGAYSEAPPMGDCIFTGAVGALILLLTIRHFMPAREKPPVQRSLPPAPASQSPSAAAAPRGSTGDATSSSAIVSKEGASGGNKCCHVPIEGWAMSKPNATAMMIHTPGKDAEIITFGALDKLADCIARRLVDKFVKCSDRKVVGVSAEGPAFIAGVLGVWKTGNAYLAMSPKIPESRLKFMLEDGQVPVVVVDQFAQDMVSRISPFLLVPDKPDDGPKLDHTPVTTDLCYLLYTSGSTGKPKGVLNTHAAMYNRFEWMWNEYPYAADEVCLAWTNIAFVDHMYEMFGGLGGGVPIVVPAMGVNLRADLRVAVEVIRDYRVSRLILVPSLLREVLVAIKVDGTLAEALPDLRILTTSGEAFPIELLDAILKEAPKDFCILNIWGTTEVAADVTCAKFTADMGVPPGTIAPIGVAIQNNKVICLDPTTLLPVPDGEVGEFFVIGIALAEGYLNRPEEQAERFMILPSGERAFRTGDFGKLDPQWGLSFTGRKDQQVKINGQRVEVLEVENALQAAIRTVGKPASSVGIVCASEGPNYKILAFICPDGPIDELREEMKKNLPVAWVPTRFECVAELPLLPTGKVDRGSLRDRAKDEGNATVEVMDSMGVLRQMGEDASITMNFVYCLYFVSIMHIMLDHWFQDCNDGYDLLGSLNIEGKAYWTRHRIWMLIFYFGVGTMEGVRSREPHFGATELTLLALWCSWWMTNWVGRVFGMCSWLLGGQHAYPLMVQFAVWWFLVWMVEAKCVLLLLDAPRRFLAPQMLEGKGAFTRAAVGFLQMFIVLAAAWAAGHFGLGFVEDIHGHKGFPWQAGPPYTTDDRSKWLLEEAGFYAGFPSHLSHTAYYVLGYWIGPDALPAMHKSLPKQIVLRVIAGVALFIVSMAAILKTTEFPNEHVVRGSCQYGGFFKHWNDPAEHCQWYSIQEFAMINGTGIIQLGLAYLAFASIPAPLAWIGQYTLAAYVIHAYWWPVIVHYGIEVNGVQFLPGAHQVIEQLGLTGLPALACLYAYCIGFVLIIAMPAYNTLRHILLPASRELSASLSMKGK